MNRATRRRLSAAARRSPRRQARRDRRTIAELSHRYGITDEAAGKALALARKIEALAQEWAHRFGIPEDQARDQIWRAITEGHGDGEPSP